MDKQFPPMMLADMRHPMVKQAWVNEFPLTHPSDCPNCGGAGVLCLVVALAGPFRSPPMGKDLGARYDTLNGNPVWWGVKTTTYECPSCRGGRQYAHDSGPVKNAAIIETASKLSGRVEQEVWTDR